MRPARTDRAGAGPGRKQHCCPTWPCCSAGTKPTTSPRSRIPADGYPAPAGFVVGLPWIGKAACWMPAPAPGFPEFLWPLQPGLEVTLLDSAGKKIRFLNHVRRELGLENITRCRTGWNRMQPIYVRCHDQPGFFRPGFVRPCCTAPGGATSRLLAMKGSYPEAELRELPDWVRVRLG